MNGSSMETWRNSLLAGLANYIDGGSIVAGSAALSLWVEHYHLSHQFVGLFGRGGDRLLDEQVNSLLQQGQGNRKMGRGWNADRRGFDGLAGGGEVLD